MGVETPNSTAQVEDRVKADVQREAPDSNPYVKTHWLRSLIAGFSRRIFDFYKDLDRTEQRLMPDTADATTAPRWGNIYIGPVNPSTQSSGSIVATGISGGIIDVGQSIASGANEYLTTSGATVSDNTLSILTINRSGTTATVVASGEHGLSSFVPVTISGTTEPEYNVIDAEIVVTDTDSFTYQVADSPSSPATGVPIAAYTSALVSVESVDFGDQTNLDADTPLTLQSPIVNVDDTMYVDFGAIGGGSNAEEIISYKARYLEKIRSPVANFNEADIIQQAKKVTGVTRVFVEPSGTVVGSIAVSALTRSGNVASVTSVGPHGYDDGQLTTVLGALEPEYNVTDTRIIIENANVFHYVVIGSPATTATGTITASTSIPLGQVRTFFMRDNDTDPIPTASEVDTVKDKIDEIRPANTASADNIVSAPNANPVDFVFTSLLPNTSTMRAAVTANLGQFFEEQTTVSQGLDEDKIRAAISNTVDPDTGDTVSSFDLSEPLGDISGASGVIPTLGLVTF